MANYTVHAIGAQNISVDGGSGSLSGFTQGSGAHLQGAEIVIKNTDFDAIELRDNDANFQDSDTSQRLDGQQSIFGETYDDGRVLEAEYKLTVEDADGNEYTLIGVNVREPGADNSYGTVEGLAFVGDIPPANTPLTVTRTSEGPKGNDTPYTSYAAPCFAAGTRIETEAGQRPVESLCVGDRVMTLDHGAQVVRWVAHFEGHTMPVRIAAGALGDGPVQDLEVSPCHRVLIRSDLAALWFDGPECLVEARHLVGRDGITVGPCPVRYTHFLLDRHQIVFANGAASESLLPGPMVIDGLAPFVRRSLERVLRDLPDARTPARPILKGWEARLIAA